MEFHRAPSLDPSFSYIYIYIYMNDLPKLIHRKFTPVLFADDFSTVLTHSNLRVLWKTQVQYLELQMIGSSEITFYKF